MRISLTMLARPVPVGLGNRNRGIIRNLNDAVKLADHRLPPDGNPAEILCVVHRAIQPKRAPWLRCDPTCDIFINLNVLSSPQTPSECILRESPHQN